MTRYSGVESIRSEVKERVEIARFWAYCLPDPVSGCWNWEGATDYVYGVFYRRGKGQIGAHRYAYELVKGPIPTGLHIDHLCRNTLCINPDHLEAVTVRENVMRASTARATINAAKTHCSNGHPLTGNNAYQFRGSRQCRTCKVEWNREYRAQLASGGC